MTTKPRIQENSPEAYMTRAIRLAQNGYPAPNPHVGCVLVKDGAIVGRGWHRFRGADHAEVMALKEAGEAAKGSTAYVTLEPCNHTSSLTGPCSGALLRAGVSKVYYACADPNPVAMGGAARLQEAGVFVHQGLLEGEARKVNEQFLVAMEQRRTFVVLKAAMSQDGFLGLPGQQVWLTGEPARRSAHRLRAECGAVLVGRGTVEVDDPLLTARIPGVVNQPVRVVLDPENRLGQDYQVFRDASAQTIRVTAPGRGGDLEVNHGSNGFDLRELTAKLFQRKILGVLVEGGPSTLDSFWRAGLADRVALFVAPICLERGLTWDLGLKLLSGKETGLTRVATRKLGADRQVSFRKIPS